MNSDNNYIERVFEPVTVQPAHRIVVTATFTAEPVQDMLEFWMDELNLPASVEFAPYDQVFQQLLDPGSLLSQNRQGVNVVLVRLEDWVRSRPRIGWPSGSRGVPGAKRGRPGRRGKDSGGPLDRAADRRPLPRLARGAWRPGCAGRASPGSRSGSSGELEPVPGLCLLRPADFDLYPVADYYDPRRDQLGHIPYTPLFFAALGTILARKVHALLQPAAQGDRPGLRQHAVERGRRRGRGRRDHDPAGLAGLAAVHGGAGGPGVPALPVQQERRARRARSL